MAVPGSSDDESYTQTTETQGNIILEMDALRAQSLARQPASMYNEDGTIRLPDGWLELLRYDEGLPLAFKHVVLHRDETDKNLFWSDGKHKPIVVTMDELKHGKASRRPGQPRVRYSYRPGSFSDDTKTVAVEITIPIHRRMKVRSTESGLVDKTHERTIKRNHPTRRHYYFGTCSFGEDARQRVLLEDPQANLVKLGDRWAHHEFVEEKYTTRIEGHIYGQADLDGVTCGTYTNSNDQLCIWEQTDCHNVQVYEREMCKKVRRKRVQGNTQTKETLTEDQSPARRRRVDSRDTITVAE